MCYNINSEREEINLSNIPNKTQQAINEFLIKINEILENKIKRIILYGSYARGDYNNFSDVDIMILTILSNEEIEEYRETISEIIFDIQIETDVYISPIIKNIDNYNLKVDFVPFYMNVQKEGVEL